jgi:exopolyphosphatase/guanosine-5'-triphosphate,3'-diphosphate pyrophosphatase
MSNLSSDPPFPHAVIDIGTNTIRLLIGSVINGKLNRLVAERAVTRLGADLSKTGILNKDNIEISIGTLIQFKALIEQYNSRDVLAIGTSALREAGNSLEFIDAVKALTGINVAIISGDKEAELTVQGVLGIEDALSIPAFITDIGGGSTEWILYEGNSNYTRSSVRVGAVGLHERFVHSDPPAPEEIINIRNEVFQALTKSFIKNDIRSGHNIDKIKSFVATGGTATTVAAIDIGLDAYDPEKVHLHEVSYTALEELFEYLSSLPVCERVNIKGLEQGRADIVLPGIVILLVLMEMLNADTMTVSDYGLLEGVLLNPGIVTA